MIGLFKALNSAVRHIKNATLAFIIAGVILFTVSFIALLAYNTTNLVPFYVFLGISALLIIVGLRTEITHRSYRTRLEGPGMPSDKERLTNVLQEAEKTLRHLETRAALFPETERPVTLSRDLEAQKSLIVELKHRLAQQSQ